MKIKDIVLTEMACSRSEAIGIVNGITRETVTHLLKLFLINSSNNTNHWKQEIKGWILRVQRIKLKSNGRHVEKQDFFDWLNINKLNINKILRDLRNDYKDCTFYDIDVDHTMQVIAGILLQVGADIEKGQFTDIDNYLP